MPQIDSGILLSGVPEGCICAAHGSSEISLHFRRIRHFVSGQRLRLETLGWLVLDFDSKPLTEDKLEGRRDKILRAPLVVSDREYPFQEDLIPDASRNVDLQLPTLTKVSSLIDVLQLGQSYELVDRLWGRFILTASRVNVTVAWSRNDALVCSVVPPENLGGLLATFLINHLFQSVNLNGMLPRVLTRITEWLKAHKQFGLEFEERGSHTWVFLGDMALKGLLPCGSGRDRPLLLRC